MPDLPVLTVTLNPALDVTTATSKVEPHRKLRCTNPYYDPGGGGINVSRAMHILGGASDAFAVLGGSTGAHVSKLLNGEGIDLTAFEIAGETRICTTLMEEATGEHYRFVLPGPEVHSDEVSALTGAFEQALMVRDYSFVVLSGSLPNGIPLDTYAKFTHMAEARGAKVILDAKGAELEAAVAESPYLVRLNHLEAQELIGGDDAEEAAHLLAGRLVEDEVTEVAIVALGHHGTAVATKEGWAHCAPPKVNVVSAVGAGDSFVGALTLGLARGWDLHDAVRFGVAAAASAVTTPATLLCEREATERFFEMCKMG